MRVAFICMPFEVVLAKAFVTQRRLVVDYNYTAEAA